MDDGLGEAMRVDCKKALKCFSPMAICVGLYYALSTVPSYMEQRGLLILFVNYVMSNITLNLMLDTMTGKKFKLIQPVIYLLLVPLISYHCFGITDAQEILLTRVLTAITLIYFYGQMSIVSMQWCDYSQTPFWYVPKSKRK